MLAANSGLKPDCVELDIEFLPWSYCLLVFIELNVLRTDLSTPKDHDSGSLRLLQGRVVHSAQ